MRRPSRIQRVKDEDTTGLVPRREFLLGTASLALAGACARGGCSMLAAPAPAAGTDDWQEVRGQFGLSPEFVHLSAMFLSTHPLPVREAIERYRQGLDENPVGYLIDNDSRLRWETIQEAARFFRASSENVALTDSTTMGLALLYNGLRLAPGDEILCEEPSYYSTVESLRYKAERSGATVQRVRIFDQPSEATADGMTDRLLQAVGPRTRVMALTWVHSDTGVKLPIRQVSQRLAELNRSRPPAERVLLCVDGVHGLGVEDVTLGELGCDFLVAGTHKWVFGPRGTGVLYAARPGLWEQVLPTIPAFGLQTTPGLEMTPGGFHSFEMRWALADAFRFLQRVGKTRIQERTRVLADHLKEGLSAQKRVTLLTPRSHQLSAGIVAFNVDRMKPREVARRLLERKCIVTPSNYGLASVRAAPSILNTPQEVDRLVEAVASL
jgi:isopenicillin-N epimerase